MKVIKQIAKTLAEGNIQKAYELRNELEPVHDRVKELELLEVAKQSMVNNLRGGSISKAKETGVLFRIPKEELDEAVKQAVLSSFRDGDIDRVKEIRDKFPLSREAGKELVEYCSSWGKPTYTECMRAVFT